jgi:hypothetical protein
MERKRIYCTRRSAVSESDNVIEALKFEGMSDSPKMINVGTGNCRSFFRKMDLKALRPHWVAGWRRR